MKIVHVITSLDDGGAEHTLYKICKYDKKNQHIVISLKGSGKYSPLLKKLKITVYNINMKKNFFLIFKFFLIRKFLINLKPDIVQTWLVHGDFFGGIASRLAGIENVAWNIRYSKLEIGKAKFSTILLTRILAKLSNLIPKLVIVVSKSAYKNCKELGYRHKKLLMIPNGYDLRNHKFKKFHKLNFRKKYNVKKNIPLIGTIARYDPKKDHSNLLKALNIVKLKKIDFECFLVGNNITHKNSVLYDEIKKLKLEKNIKLLGKKNNILEIMKGIDLYIQSSSSEGFPNVIAESMACKTPCVSTNAGDASFIIGKTGWIVPIKNSKLLSHAIEKALNELKSANWKLRCTQARNRIKSKFSIFQMLEAYNKTWIRLIKS